MTTRTSDDNKARWTKRDPEQDRFDLVALGRAKLDFLTHSFWEAGVVNFEEPHDFPGATRLAYHYLGEGLDTGVLITEIPGPRWFDLWRAADKLLELSPNKDHRFIERFVPAVEGQRFPGAISFTDAGPNFGRGLVFDDVLALVGNCEGLLILRTGS